MCRDCLKHDMIGALSHTHSHTLAHTLIYHAYRMPVTIKTNRKKKTKNFQ